MNEVNMPRLTDVWTVPLSTVTGRKWNVLASNKPNSAAQPFESSSRLQVRTQRGRLRSPLRVLMKQTRVNCALFSFHVSILFKFCTLIKCQSKNFEIT